MAQWLSWLERRPVTAKVVGSSPIWVVKGLFNPCGVLAQLGEHLPYKQRVIGSSPIGPIFMFEMKENVFMRMHRGVFCVYDEPSTDLCLHKNLYLEENNCYGIICIYGTLTKNERIAMME